MLKKKTTRKELLKSPDKFVTLSARILEFTSKYKALTASLIGLVLLVTMSFIGFQYFSKKSQAAAFNLLDQAIFQFASQKEDKGVEAAYAGSEKNFSAVIEKYSGNKAGKDAGLIYAGISCEAGKYEKGIRLYLKAFEDFKSEPFYRNLILNALGCAYQAQKNYKTAEIYFQQIVSSSESALKDQALFHLGQINLKMHKSDKSKKFFQKLITEHPNSPYVEIVTELI